MVIESPGIDPITLLTVGSRDDGSRLQRREGLPWIRFFDKVHQRPYTNHRVDLQPSRVRAERRGHAATILVDGMTAESFQGRLEITVYPGTSLIHLEAVLQTEEDLKAILYHPGIALPKLDGPSPSGAEADLYWRDTQGNDYRQPLRSGLASRALAVQHRMLIHRGSQGSLAIFPPPHQYFYPLDFSNNYEFTWFGEGFLELEPRLAFGIRHPFDGDNRFVPWFNAPPGTEQRLGVFYHVTRSPASEAMDEVLRFTNNDRYPALPGHIRFTSHYHVEHTTDLQNRLKEGRPVPVVPDFIRAFLRIGVDAVHLAEFHFGRTPRLPAPERLENLKLMHDECARLSTPDFLVLPGEEPNVHFGGHWLSFFPRPVYWVLNRQAGEPFRETLPEYGAVYRVGSADDVFRLLQEQEGLAWTAHPRIKSSRGYPDSYRDEPFYRSDRFFGAAWKAMPADLSRDRLGERVLDLQDDMANWGQKKYILGEVDVFKIDETHELYGHMNMNYVRLDRLPRFEQGWGSIVTAISDGAYFVTTGEVLIPHFRIGGRESGESMASGEAGRARLQADVRWTFPPAFAVVVSGDGERVFRERIDLREQRAFGSVTLDQELDLRGRTWARLEVWDVAKNGAFTPPVWIE